jgi:WD40 repeat protein
MKTLHGHKNSVRSVCISNDGKKIVSGSWDDTIKIWEAQTGNNIKTLYGYKIFLNSVCISKDDKRIVSGGHKILKIWDA